jgi:2-methylisocitrate lyase-like PEP mutase family enzyme
MVSSIQKVKADLFLTYHQDKEILALLNSWDIGSSKLIEACGYKLQDLGVARLSLGSGLMKATLALIKKVADELSKKGTYHILLGTLAPLPDAAMAYKMATRLNK